MEGGGESETETHTAAKSGEKGNQQLGLRRDLPTAHSRLCQHVWTRSRLSLSLSLQLIQFLLSLVQSNGILGLKRKMQVYSVSSISARLPPDGANPFALSTVH